MSYNSSIIALAWPDTKVVKEGKWYDLPMQWFGFIKDGCYTAGHAAFLLVNHDNNEIHYFDYGRYQAPYQFGRVRDKVTDPDVAMKHQAIFEKGELINLEEILVERFHNRACHGDYKLTAVIVRNIDFDKAYAKAKKLQAQEAIPYGPFKIKGSTCSRIVVQVVHASTNNWLTKLLIKVPYTISATPRSNKKVLNDMAFYYEVNNGKISTYKNGWFWVKKLATNKTQQELPQIA
jgi:hypothetical protein